jgi:SAM-dependent methyltransferase
VTVYWYGNCAKYRTVRKLILEPRSSVPTRVFDYGCGDGGDWPRILRDYSNIALIGYEPDPTRAAAARERLRGTRAEIVTGTDPPCEPLGADVIVSFSVLEHVVDRPAYLATAMKHLARAGRFVLNYDDGHFRNDLRLETPSQWAEPLRAAARHLAAPIRARAGRHGSYVRSIPYRDVDELVRTAGFVVLEDRLENLSDFKALAKRVPPAGQKAFMQLWLSTEDALNRDLGAVVDGNDVPVLWDRMGSRTLVLASGRD